MPCRDDTELLCDAYGTDYGADIRTSPKGDEKEWKALADYVKAAIMRDYYGACNRTESYLSCVLFFGLSENPEKGSKELAGIVRRKGYRAGGGIFGSVYTLEMLTRYGYQEDALKIAGQKEFGLGLYASEWGGTLWEHWAGRRAP